MAGNGSSQSEILFQFISDLLLYHSFLVFLGSLIVTFHGN